MWCLRGLSAELAGGAGASTGRKLKATQGVAAAPGCLEATAHSQRSDIFPHCSLECRAGSTVMQGITRFVPPELHTEADREVGGVYSRWQLLSCTAALHCPCHAQVLAKRVVPLAFLLAEFSVPPCPLSPLPPPLRRWKSNWQLPTAPSKKCLCGTGKPSTGACRHLPPGRDTPSSHPGIHI